MTAEMFAWIATCTRRYNAIPFLLIGRYGSQYLLMAWKPTSWVH
jgi:hypothetical protein